MRCYFRFDQYFPPLLGPGLAVDQDQRVREVVEDNYTYQVGSHLAISCIFVWWLAQKHQNTVRISRWQTASMEAPQEESRLDGGNGDTWLNFRMPLRILWLTFEVDFMIGGLIGTAARPDLSVGFT